MEMRGKGKLWDTPMRRKSPNRVEGKPLPKLRGVVRRGSPPQLTASSVYRHNPTSSLSYRRESRFPKLESPGPSPLARSPKRTIKQSIDRPEFFLEMSHRKTLSTTVSTTADSIQIHSLDRSKDLSRREDLFQQSAADGLNVIQTPSSIREEPEEQDGQMLLDEELVSYYEHELSPGLRSIAHREEDTPDPTQSKTPDLRSMTMISFCRRSVLKQKTLQGDEIIDPEPSNTPPLGRQHNHSVAEAPLEAEKPAANHDESAKLRSPLKFRKRTEVGGKLIGNPGLRKGQKSPFGATLHKRKPRRRSPL